MRYNHNIQEFNKCYIYSFKEGSKEENPPDIKGRKNKKLNEKENSKYI